MLVYKLGVININAQITYDYLFSIIHIVLLLLLLL